MKIIQKVIDDFRNQIENYYNNKSLVTDGIICINQYNSAKYKILWLLKEPYGNGGFDYSEYISEFKFKGRFPTSSLMWSRIIYANYGILNKFIKYDDMDWLHKNENVFSALRSCAIINLKKTPGRTKSDYYDIRSHYKESKEIIIKQIELISPDIIICGGTFSFIKEDFNILQTFNNEGRLGYLSKNRLFINTYHPSYFGVDSESYCDDIINCCRMWETRQI